MQQLSLSDIAPHNGVETSAAAAQSLSPENLSKKRLMVLHACLGLMPSGATCEQVEELTGLSHQTCSARMNELANCEPPFLVFKCNPETGKPESRSNKSGRKARIYFVSSGVPLTQPEPEYDPEELF